MIKEHQEYDESSKIPFIPSVVIGIGSIGVIEEVKGQDDTFRGQTYARKTMILLNNLEDRKKELETMAEEVKIMKSLCHKHVVRLVMSYTWQNNFCIVIDPRAESSLEEYLVNQTKPRNHIAGWFRCLISGISYVHERGLRHRDIKPHNLLLKGSKLLLTDFGISMMGLGKTVPTTVKGAPRSRTLEYCSPEVHDGSTRGRSADMFSIGAVFLEMAIASISSDELQTFRDALKVGDRYSYALNVTTAQNKIGSLGSSEGHDPWLNSILFLCGKMIQANRYLRPKAGDVSAWWSWNRVSTTMSPDDCSCDLSSSTALPYHEEGLNENLRRAYANGHTLMVDLFKERGAELSKDATLIAAAEGGLSDIVRCVIAENADARTKAVSKVSFEVALRRAASAGFAETVEVLLDRVADIESASDDGTTALAAASNQGHKDVVRLLLDKGARH